MWQSFGPMELLATQHMSRNVNVYLNFIGPNNHHVNFLNPPVLQPTLCRLYATLTSPVTCQFLGHLLRCLAEPVTASVPPYQFHLHSKQDAIIWLACGLTRASCDAHAPPTPEHHYHIQWVCRFLSGHPSKIAIHHVNALYKLQRLTITPMMDRYNYVIGHCNTYSCTDYKFQMVSRTANYTPLETDAHPSTHIRLLSLYWLIYPQDFIIANFTND